MTRRADLDDALRGLTVEVKRISDGIRLAVSGQQLIAAIETDPFWQDIGRSTEEQGTIAGILNGWPSPSVMVPDVGEVYFRIK